MTNPNQTTTAHEKLTWIEDRLAEGKTVYICTYTRATKITPKTAARWAAAGNILIKVDASGSLVMARGHHYDDIGGCGLRAREEA